MTTYNYYTTVPFVITCTILIISLKRFSPTSKIKNKNKIKEVIINCIDYKGEVR
jgi:hypothetical protein